MKVLLTGWFSFEEMGATAGDLMVCDVVAEWLHTCGRDLDVAFAPPFRGGVDWRQVDPGNYSHVVFVCGPFGNGPPLIDFLDRFAGVPLVGVNLSMLDPVETWNPFDLLFERDSSRSARPDVSLLARQERVPVVGVILLDVLPGVGKRNGLEASNAAIREFVASREMAAVSISTRLDINATGLRTAREIETLISRMDVVITTRLHGLVLSIKNDVPVVALDPVIGGGKISRQAASLGWPALLAGATATVEEIGALFDYCRTADARARTFEVRQLAEASLGMVREQFLEYFQNTADRARR